MNITTANWAEYKGQTVTLQLVNGACTEGALISLNSKGWNVKDSDGRTITHTQSVVVDISTGGVEGVEDIPEDEAFEDIDLNFEEIDLDIHDEELPEVDNDEDFEEGDSTRELPDADSDEGHTTAELAEMFETTARELRKTLRKLGLGVGRGRRYSLTDADIAKVRETVQA